MLAEERTDAFIAVHNAILQLLKACQPPFMTSSWH